MKLSRIKTNLTKATDGVWHDGGDGLKLLVAMEGNSKSTEFARRLAKPFQKSINNGTIAREDIEDMNCKVLANTILLGWQNLQNDDGTPMEYSVEKAEEILRAPEYGEFMKMIVGMSREMALYRDDVEAEASGN